jgi:dihydrofolate reductase
MPFYAIAAMSENRVIGNQGKIPWHLPEDFRWFKHKTMGGTLIMGRKTFESIGKPLPGRKTLILSRLANPTFPQPTYTFKTLFDDYVPKHIDESYWVCGGGEIYEQLLDHCHYLYLTVVKKQEEGDTFFPSSEHLNHTHALEQVLHENTAFRLERWKNKKLPSEFAFPVEAWPFGTDPSTNSG